MNEEGGGKRGEGGGRRGGVDIDRKAETVISITITFWDIFIRRETTERGQNLEFGEGFERKFTVN